jgi:hypothetical protein
MLRMVKRTQKDFVCVLNVVVRPVKSLPSACSGRLSSTI